MMDRQSMAPRDSTFQNLHTNEIMNASDLIEL